MIINNSKNEILKEGTKGEVREVCVKNCSDASFSKIKRENDPIGKSVNIPLNVLGQYYRNRSAEHVPARRYTKAKRIETLAVNKFKQNGLGISFNELLSNGLAEHKAASSTYC